MKILIGCPTYERYSYCIDLWIKRVEEIIEFSKGKHEVDYLLADNSQSEDFFNNLKKKGIKVIKAPYFENVKERIVHSRNLLREKAMKEDYDYFFSLEQDIIPEKNILIKFLEHQKDIVAGYYGKPMTLVVQDKETKEIKKITIELSLVYLQEGDKIRRANPQEILNKGLIKVGGIGVGCVLISKEVLNKVKFRYEQNKVAFDDMFFCIDAKKEGYDLFLDSEIKPRHLHKPWN
ncbi:glycosyltransferase family 2 protein [Nanoarchaeota archaeon]